MSANNQTLIKRYKEKYYVFSNVNAESWDRINVLNKDAGIKYGKYINALEYAKKVEDMEPTEYGIVDDVLYKDGASIVLR